MGLAIMGLVNLGQDLKGNKQKSTYLGYDEALLNYKVEIID